MTRTFNWCGQCGYVGRAPFLIGTVQATGYEEARAKLADLWSSLSPHPAPEIVPMQGTLVFHPEDAA